MKVSPDDLEQITGREPVIGDPNAIRVLFRHHRPLTILIKDWVQLGLKLGLSVSQQLLLEITDCSNVVEAEQFAISYLTGRVRTKHQVEDHLIRKGLPPEVVNEATARLEARGIINDYLYAQMFVEQNALRWSPQQLRAKLIYRGIPNDMVSEILTRCLDVTSQQTALTREVKKVIRRRGIPETAEERYKLMGVLARKGFPLDAIRSIVDQVIAEMQDEATGYS